MDNRHNTVATVVDRSISEIPVVRTITMTKRTTTYQRRRVTSTIARDTKKRPTVRPDRMLKAKIDRRRQKKLALLLPGHNEELIIATTIRSAIAAGQNKRDIYVVDDCSSDKTRQEAIALLGKDHVLTVHRSGKALAVKKAIKKFQLDANYQWLHVADADSVFGTDYFRIYRKKLNPKKYAVAVGFVQSLRGNWISTYRAASYTYSQHVTRRIQSKLGMISVPQPRTSDWNLRRTNISTKAVTKITTSIQRRK